MSKDWTKCFITSIVKYALLDDGGDIRATAYDIEGIALAKNHYGWGAIHRCEYKNGKLTIKEVIE